MSGSDGETSVKAVSLFSGLGGIDIGLHRLGIETVVCVEKNDAAAKTLKINSIQHDVRPEEAYIDIQERYPWQVIDKNIRDVDADKILETAGTDKDEIDLVVGGPPCQTFSRSNEGSRSGTETARGRLYKEFTRILHEIQPAAFIFENVRGLKSANGGNDLQTIQKALEGDTYTSDYKVLNAADYGVPQTRKRIFILGTRQDAGPSFPDPTHTQNGCNRTEKWMTVGEALDEFDIDESIEDTGGYTNAIGSKYGSLLQDIPEGANYQHFSERKYDPEAKEYVEREESELDQKEFDWRSRHWNYLLKLDQDRPAWTIQAEPGTTVGPFHWRARDLSLLEQMKLMDLPLDYYISGTPGQIQQQIGNAVPPRLAAVIARELVCEIGHSPISTETVDQVNNPTTSDISENVPFTVSVDTGNSPWANANLILRVLLAEGAVVVRAHQQGIPMALDAIEIAQRQMESELRVIVDEEISKDAQDNKVVNSELRAKVLTEKAMTVVAGSTTGNSVQPGQR